jgi:ketosteroid isomerase-like protein
MPVLTPHEAVKALDQAFARRDMEALLAFYEDGAAVVTEPGRMIRRKEDVRKFFTQLFATNGEAHQLDSHIIEADGIALFHLEVAVYRGKARRSTLFTRIGSDGRASKRRRWQLADPH